MTNPSDNSSNSISNSISKSEREELIRLNKEREKVLIAGIKQRALEMMAELENTLGSVFRFDDDQIWAQAMKAAEAEVAKANQKIAARCGELGIPARFAPTLDLCWSSRGSDNAVAVRKAELRRMAQTRVAADEQKAMVEVQVACLEARTQLTVAGLTSEAARGFMERLPDIKTLMPALSFSEVAGEAEPPLVEQLVTPNALRQRRYRERQAALRNAKVTSHNGEPLQAVPSADDVPEEPDGAGQ
jgi:hypothetical protein